MHSDSASNPSSRAPVIGISIGEYLIRRIQECQVRHVFGIPGDYVLNFYGQLEASPLEVVSCTREDCAGYATDAYARINGLGVVCVTYCVGGLSLCNSVAGAWAEKSPVLVISGSPGMEERRNDPLLHHRVKDFHTQIDVFQRLCIAGSELSDSLTAFKEVDRVLDAIIRYKRPGYLELPRDMVNVVPEMPHVPTQFTATSDQAALAEALAEAKRRIEQAEKVAIIAGVEIHRFGLQDDLLELIEQSEIPFTSTALGKSVISETHPLYAGLYEGAMGRDEVTRFVEESDCVLMLGAFMTDINMGIYTANLDPAKCIYATSESLRISYHHYHNVQLSDFIRGLARERPRIRPRSLPPKPPAAVEGYQLQPDVPCNIERIMARLNQSIDETTCIVADVGDSLFASAELTIQQRTQFVSPAYYTSMGFGVPAALGAQKADPSLRPIVLVGDGAFQMTGMELSTIVRHGLNPIVLLLDNQGYGTERFLHPGDYEFNEILPWAYHKIPEVLGRGRGFEVRTEGEFDHALREALADTSQMSLIQIHLPRTECSRPLKRLAEKLASHI